MAACVRDFGIPGTLSGADAGLHMLLRMENGLSEETLVRRAAEYGVAVYPLSDCCLTPPPPDAPPTLVMGYARLKVADMISAFRRLQRAWL